MKNIIIIHYAEIALKGENRRIFEKKLVENIRQALKDLKYEKIERLNGRILIILNSEDKSESFKVALNHVFGISHFSFGWEASAEMEEIKKTLAEKLKERIKSDFSVIARSPERAERSEGRRSNPVVPAHNHGIAAFPPVARNDITFRITAHRAEKNFPLTSNQINYQAGEYILENDKFQMTNDKKEEIKLKVKLKDPDINCFIEIVGDKALLYFDKIKALGGLPVGVSGNVLSLISSGFDSPVAAWHLMKRGARVNFIHFHSYPRTSKASINNVKNLIKILDKYQFGSVLYLAPLLDIQREIFAKGEERLRIILYRRFMFRIAEALAGEINAGALVTGESLGQVASQTLENIGVVNKAVFIPVFRPFIGADKIEIIDQAKKIGTYEFSKAPYEDCCSLFTPRHPATKARLRDIEFEESKLDSKKLIKEAIRKIEKVEIK